MELLVQPDDGITPLITAIKHATTSVDVVIFRADMKEFQKTLEDAIARGVAVHALIAHTNKGGEKRLRKLEQALLKAGVIVSRTGEDLVRYHGKMLVIDKRTLYVLGFNYTYLDVFKSRSFGVVTENKAVVQDALKVFEADALRQPYVPTVDSLVVSPENSRARLAALLKAARKELLIYDPKIADGPMIRLLKERAKAGVEIRILGKVTSRSDDLQVERLPKLRLHVRAILRDNEDLFVGSQSLRGLELDRRREIGLVVKDPKIIKRFREVFEEDWDLTESGKRRKHSDGEKKHGDGQKDEEKDEALVSK
jgi:phosphatidylserine/phosphatidylglycerophosphate/cardiolipin synthase-like enzyme